MTAALFVTDASGLDADPIVLSGAEGHHAARVRRVAVGENVDVTDGRGRIASCIVSRVDGDSVTLATAERRQLPAPRPRVVVVQALPKGDRGELAVEMLTEIGVDVIVPWSAARCVTVWRGERGERALAKWRAHAREAAKQAHRAWHPVVEAPGGTAAVVRRLSSAARAVVLHESASLPLSSLDLPEDGDVVLVVGPEGGISPEELDEFTAAGALACRMGETVLRTSTAGVAGAAAVLSRTGRWR